ncbi:hypothetical protein BSY18_1826 [Blastomonas sp. RAC04]|nr:hypothetical protein BSY18_1826 [Blastomonas sp. RAC04]
MRDTNQNGTHKKSYARSILEETTKSYTEPYALLACPVAKRYDQRLT